MAFDKPTRNRLASFVGKTRDLIANEFTQQFQSLYGISDQGTITPLNQLGHLDDTGLAIAALLRERIDYLVKTHPDDRDGVKAAVTRLAREQAFTVLNRLAAIRMAEKRGIIVESVGKGYQSKGFKVFEQVAGSGLGDIYHRYCRYLFCLFDELAVDLGVLFDRRSPQGLLFPRETALQALFVSLNASDLELLWAEDETIGWVYQYYNDPAERKKMRDESAAPRNSRELAVRNQFFTPRYVVEFLTDNSLGRIWYEMTKGETRLSKLCRYLVQRPTEIFLKDGESSSEAPGQEQLSQVALLTQPVYIPHRRLKDPRELRMLDPACGSMHFGLYSFDLYEIIYEEAWDLGAVGLHRDFPDRSSFLREVPRLIIEHNIHGIDIDPRAVQIAGLSLWLRAQRSWQDQRVPAIQRARILRSNIVCAEPMPGNPELLKGFTAPLHPPVLGQLVGKIFEQMQLAGEVGSLLKIEDEITDLVKEAKKLWQGRPIAEQMMLNLGQESKSLQENYFLDLSGISDKHFWETAEDKIYAALRSYAELIESGSYQRRLFAEDSARGFAFIDVCRKRYDVVLMNPPFGEVSEKAKFYILEKYPDSKNDLYASFVEEGVNRKLSSGRLGAITSRTGLFLISFHNWRNKVLLTESQPVLLADLGKEVLDGAVVETAAYVIETTSSILSSFCLLSQEDKSTALFHCVQSMANGVENSLVFSATPSEFSLIPGAPFAYWTSENVRNVFNQLPSFDNEPLGRATRCGLGTLDDFRFLRLFWELPSRSSDWRTYYNGGVYSPFCDSFPLKVGWADNGKEVKTFVEQKVGSASRKVQGEDKYFKPGFVFPRRTKAFSPKFMPSGGIFSTGGQAGFVSNEDLAWSISLLASRVCTFLISLSQGRTGDAAQYEVGLVKRLPWPTFVSSDCKQKLSEIAIEIYNIRSNLISRELTSYEFSYPKLLSHRKFGLKKCIDIENNNHQESILKIDKLTNDIDNISLLLYGLTEKDVECLSMLSKIEDIAGIVSISDEINNSATQYATDTGCYDTSSMIDYFTGATVGLWDVRYTTGDKCVNGWSDPLAALPVFPTGVLQNSLGLPAVPDDVPANYPLHISWVGILVDDENHPADIVTRVSDVLEMVWNDHADTIAHEVCELLSVKTLRDFFRRPTGFFADHLKRYSKSRRQAPIYWPLSSIKGSYTLWIYYHRLTDQTLHTALADFVDPKLKSVRAEISSLRESATNQTHLEELLDLEKELADFHDEIERIIKLPWKPNLNDGVLITASPLWKLFRLPKWQKDLKACWEKLEKGDYDWAHLAYSIWPKRVEGVCKKDRSIAIAHGLENLCEIAPPKATKKRGKKSVQFELEETSD